MSALRDALRSLPKTVFADVLESEEAYLLVVDLPGTSGDGVDLHVEDGRLSVEARREKAVPDGFTYRTEERPLFLDADIPLPPDATDEAAEASIERGVLTVRLPKRRRSTTSIPVED